MTCESYSRVPYMPCRPWERHCFVRWLGQELADHLSTIAHAGARLSSHMLANIHVLSGAVTILEAAGGLTAAVHLLLDRLRQLLTLLAGVARVMLVPRPPFPMGTSTFPAGSMQAHVTLSGAALLLFTCGQAVRQQR